MLDGLNQESLYNIAAVMLSGPGNLPQTPIPSALASLSAPSLILVINPRSSQKIERWVTGYSSHIARIFGIDTDPSPILRDLAFVFSIAGHCCHMYHFSPSQCST